MRNLTVYQRFAMIIAALTMVLFAVVANEVKALSSQTAKAADEITGSIAAAVEEQGAATNEIARSVHQAAEAPRDDAKHHGRSRSFQSGQRCRDPRLECRCQLTSQSEQLERETGKFLANIRAA